VHPPHIREIAATMRADGIAFADICKAFGLSRNTVADWLYGERARRRSTQPRQRLQYPAAARFPASRMIPPTTPIRSACIWATATCP
jgi:hypothetical protein